MQQGREKNLGSNTVKKETTWATGNSDIKMNLKKVG